MKTIIFLFADLQITTMIEGAVTTLLPTAVGGQPTPTPTTQATTTHHLPITPKTCTTAAETGRTKGSEEGVFQGELAEAPQRPMECVLCDTVVHRFSRHRFSRKIRFNRQFKKIAATNL